LAVSAAHVDSTFARNDDIILKAYDAGN